jgi:hypothetical protein
VKSGLNQEVPVLNKDSIALPSPSKSEAHWKHATIDEQNSTKSQCVIMHYRHLAGCQLRIVPVFSDVVVIFFSWVIVFILSG